MDIKSNQHRFADTEQENGIHWQYDLRRRRIETDIDRRRLYRRRQDEQGNNPVRDYRLVEKGIIPLRPRMPSGMRPVGCNKVAFLWNARNRFGYNFYRAVFPTGIKRKIKMKIEAQNLISTLFTKQNTLSSLCLEKIANKKVVCVTLISASPLSSCQEYINFPSLIRLFFVPLRQFNQNKINYGSSI